MTGISPDLLCPIFAKLPPARRLLLFSLRNPHRLSVSSMSSFYRSCIVEEAKPKETAKNKPVKGSERVQASKKGKSYDMYKQRHVPKVARNSSHETASTGLAVLGLAVQKAFSTSPKTSTVNLCTWTAFQHMCHR